jgi:hypothetical protein
MHTIIANMAEDLVVTHLQQAELAPVAYQWLNYGVTR